MLEVEELRRNSSENKRYETFQEMMYCMCALTYDDNTRQPFFLDCGHTFCKPCIEKTIKFLNSTCPTCREPFDGDRVFACSKNLNVLDFIAIQEKKAKSSARMCEVHTTKKIKYYCIQDKAFLCSKCVLSAHLGHKLVDAKIPLERDDLL